MNETPDNGATTTKGAPAKWRRVLGSVLALAFLVGGAWFLYRRREVLMANTELRPGFLLPLVVAEAVMLAARGLLTRELSRPFGVQLGVGEAVALSSWTTFANFLAPLLGGTGLRAAYLKRRHHLPVSHFISVQAATYTLQFLLTSACGLAAMAVVDLRRGAPATSLGVFFAACLATCGILLVLPARSTGSPRSDTWLGRVVEGVARIRGSRMASLAALLLLNFVGSCTSLAAAFALIGHPLTLPGAVLVAAVAAFSVVLSLTPSAFGITESIVVFAAGLVFVPSAVALLSAAIKRLAAIAVTSLAAAAAAAGMGRHRPQTLNGSGSG